MSNQTQVPQNRVAQKAQAYLKENEVLLKKHKLVARLVINFPTKRKIPLLSRIALWIVAKQGGRNDIQFVEINK